MKFEIIVRVRRDVDIPDEEVPRLLKAVNRRFSTPGEPIWPYDLIVQAGIDGLIEELPEGWMTQDRERIPEDWQPEGEL